MAACVQCKKDWPDSRMILTAKGSLCPECEMQRDQEKELFRGVWLTAASGPGFAFSFSLAGLISTVCLGAFAPAVWLIGGIVVGVMAVRAGLLLWSLRTDYADTNVSPLSQGALGVGGVLGAFWAFWLLLFGAFGLLGAVGTLM